jgi:hypothetical protein
LAKAKTLKPFSNHDYYLFSGLDESVKIVESMGGWCRGQIVDISLRGEVYKAAAEIKNNFGDVSLTNGRLMRLSGEINVLGLCGCDVKLEVLTIFILVVVICFSKFLNKL